MEGGGTICNERFGCFEFPLPVEWIGFKFRNCGGYEFSGSIQRGQVCGGGKPGPDGGKGWFGAAGDVDRFQSQCFYFESSDHWRPGFGGDTDCDWRSIPGGVA